MDNRSKRTLELDWGSRVERIDKSSINKFKLDKQKKHGLITRAFVLLNKIKCF